MRPIDADALIIDLMDAGLDQIQMGDYSEVIQVIERQPTVNQWHRVEEPPKEGTWCVIAKHSYLQPHNLFYDIAHYLHGTFSVYDSGVGDWFDGKPLYWMPIEPPKEITNE